MPFLTTDRLILRRLEEGDFEDFYAYSQDLELCRMIGRPPITDRESAMPTFRWLLDKEPRAYAILLRDTGRVIGNLTVTRPSELLTKQLRYRMAKGCSLSFCIGRKYQRRGLMTELLRAMLSQLFRQEKMDYVNCGFFDFNQASKGLQQKLGFQPAAQESFTWDGETFHVQEQVLWKKDWKRENNA